MVHQHVYYSCQRLTCVSLLTRREKILYYICYIFALMCKNKIKFLKVDLYSLVFYIGVHIAILALI